MVHSKITAGLGALILLASLTACTGAPSGSDDSGASSKSGTSADSGTSAESEASGEATEANALGTDANALLAGFDLAGATTVSDLIEQLESQPLAERPDGLLASVQVDALVLSSEEKKVTLPLEEGQFHLSVAPYLLETHECFYHSLTTCAGELAGQQMHITITDDATKDVLVDREVTTFENGYFDVWLPSDRDITLSIDDGEHTAEVPLGTRADDPTCVTTIKLS
jgi:hypothetical protein